MALACGGYEKLNNGCYAPKVLHMFLRAPVETYKIDETFTVTKLRNLSKFVLVCGVKFDGSKDNRNGFYRDHHYNIVSVDTNGMVLMFNTHAKKNRPENAHSDGIFRGEFQVSFEEFKKGFKGGKLHVCRAGKVTSDNTTMSMTHKQGNKAADTCPDKVLLPVTKVTVKESVKVWLSASTRANKDGPPYKAGFVFYKAAPDGRLESNNEVVTY